MLKAELLDCQDLTKIRYVTEVEDGVEGIIGRPGDGLWPIKLSPRYSHFKHNRHNAKMRKLFGHCKVRSWSGIFFTFIL